MAKITLHFPNQEAYDAYWQGSTPGSKFLCIIEDSGIEGVDNVLITSSNNNQTSSEIVPMGTSTIEIISTQASELEDYKSGDVVSKTEYDAVVEELNEANEITTDIKEN